MCGGSFGSAMLDSWRGGPRLVDLGGSTGAISVRGCSCGPQQVAGNSELAYGSDGTCLSVDTWPGCQYGGPPGEKRTKTPSLPTHWAPSSPA